ncbi:MAG: hypothetical protein WBQ75_06890 [Acetobacteraceae bacterium]
MIGRRSVMGGLGLTSLYASLKGGRAAVAPAATLPDVTGLSVLCSDGQIFAAWRGPGEPDAERPPLWHALLRSERPITEETAGTAETVAWGVFGPVSALGRMASGPVAALIAGPPPATDLAVITATVRRRSYYAAVAIDRTNGRRSRIVPGESATAQPTLEIPGEIEPIQLLGPDGRPNPDQASDAGLPLMLALHAHGGKVGPVGRNGEYVYFGNQQMGYRDGLPGWFALERDPGLPTRAGGSRAKMLRLLPRDMVLGPDGIRQLDTFWFGYQAIPQGARDRHAYAYPFTERRLLWLLAWARERFHVDQKRIYATGQSMGGWGTSFFALRHSEIFAAVYPMMPRFREGDLSSLTAPTRYIPERAHIKVLMPDGVTDFFQRMDMVRFVREHPGELPFLVWSIGRHDGFATWQEQVDMVRALTATRRGFAFAWNDGHHGDGPYPMHALMAAYPPALFALDESYPAFTGSSLDSDLGTGDPTTGDLSGGINLGFVWSDLRDSPRGWEASIGNDIAKDVAVVDVTPRRVQRFTLGPNASIEWRTSRGQAGVVTADEAGLVTVPRMRLEPGRMTRLSLSRRS